MVMIRWTFSRGRGDCMFLESRITPIYSSTVVASIAFLDSQRNIQLVEYQCEESHGCEKVIEQMHDKLNTLVMVCNQTDSFR